MPISRREFLESMATTAAATTLSPTLAAPNRKPGQQAPLYDDELPIHHPESPVASADEPFAHAFAADDDDILNHALSPEWRARLLTGM
jgi:hypothetical protein